MPFDNPVRFRLIENMANFETFFCEGQKEPKVINGKSSPLLRPLRLINYLSICSQNHPLLVYHFALSA